MQETKILQELPKFISKAVEEQELLGYKLSHTEPAKKGIVNCVFVPMSQKELYEMYYNGRLRIKSLEESRDYEAAFWKSKLYKTRWYLAASITVTVAICIRLILERFA